jgi:hypothetical protein
MSKINGKQKDPDFAPQPTLKWRDAFFGLPED